VVRAVVAVGNHRLAGRERPTKVGLVRPVVVTLLLVVVAVAVVLR
jgi:hypothetical protein